MLCPKEAIGIVGRGALFYEELTVESRNDVNSLLYKLWDVFHPKSIDTNCGFRSSFTGFHWKLAFSDDAYVNLLNNVLQNSQTDSAPLELKQFKSFISHFRQVLPYYSNNDVQKLWSQRQSDWNFYVKRSYLLLRKEQPVHYRLSESHCREVIENEIMFDLDEPPHETSIYLELETNDSEKEFVMVKYEQEINQMMDKMMMVVKVMQRHCRELLMVHGHVEKNTIDAAVGWFKIYMRTKKRSVWSKTGSFEPKRVTVVVEAQFTVFAFIFFVSYFRSGKYTEIALKEWISSYKYINMDMIIKEKKLAASKCQKCKIFKKMRHEFHWMKERLQLYPLHMLLKDGLVISGKSNIQVARETGNFTRSKFFKKKVPSPSSSNSWRARIHKT